MPILPIFYDTNGPRCRSMLELELAGPGNGWTIKTRDLMDRESASGGLPGSTPLDRVGETGPFDFLLNNHESNSVGLRGAYSPDHANCLAGFSEGIRVRYSQVVAGEKIVLHFGTLDAIQPDPDPLAGSFFVKCTSVDYMDDLARASVKGLAMLQTVRDDQVFSALVASVPRQPPSIQSFPGPDTFPVALDQLQSTDKLMSVLVDLCVSSLSFCFMSGETLVYEPRNIRAASTTPLDTFDRNLAGLEVLRNRVNRINRAEYITHPRTVDAAPTTVLYDLPAGAANAIYIPAATSIVIWTPFTDPVTKDSIGALNVQALVATTDYLLNAAADGSGTDLTTNLAVVTAPEGNTAAHTITNNGADGYVTRLKVKGKGIYDFAPLPLVAEDTVSQVNAGLNTISLDGVWQASAQTGYEFCVYIVNLYAGAKSQIPKVRFRIPATDIVLAGRVLRRRISDRIALGEALTGLSTARHSFINHIAVAADERNNLTVEWLLAPADTTAYWLLGIVGRSELDATTRPGFGLVLGHTDVAHGDSHTDVAHGDVAHTDTHTDDAHIDVAHGDGGGHGDVAHADAAHNDTAHADGAAHGDSHADVAHADVAHGDSHTDVAHGDVAHSDVAHSDVTHSDTAHADFTDIHPFPDGRHDDSPHDDVAHADIAHVDSHVDSAHADATTSTAHDDTAHSDGHTDAAHGDTAHGDTAHADVSHADESHADTAHADVAHADVAHADVAHTDVAHTDVHADAEHGDVN